jgi:hypothetical protein
MNRSAMLLFLTAAITLGAQSQTNTQVDAQAGAQVSTQGSSVGASTAESAKSDQGGSSLSSGTTFNAALTAPVDSKKAKAGDRVSARATEAVKSEGKVVLPKGTKLLGHVTQASARAKGDAESSLAITFDRAILKGGQEVPLSVAIQALASAATGDREVGTYPINNVGANGASATGAGGHGMLIGVGSTAGGAAANAAGHVSGTADAAVNSTASTTANISGASPGAVGGLNAAGQLTSNSQGVFGLNGLNLSAATSSRTQASVITSDGKNVHLDCGTRMLLVTQTAATAVPPP